MAGRKKITLENTPGVWLRADKRYGWEYENRFADGTPFRRAGSRKTLADAKASWEFAQAEFQGGPKNDAERSLKDWAEYCLDTLFPTQGVSDRELDNRRSGFKKHWYKPLGHLALESITKQQVRAILKEKEEDGSLSYDGRRNIRNHLSAVYRAAQAEFKGFTANPADVEIGTRPTRNAEGLKVTHKRTLTTEEQAALLNAAKSSPYWIGIFLGLKLGLRRGEILGLKWVHVDFKENVIHIRDNVQRAAGKGKVPRDTKTTAGQRRIPIPAVVKVALLKVWSIKSPFVMPSERAKPPEPRKFSDAMETFRKTAKLVCNSNRWGEPLPDPTLHDLRHTFAAVMANEKKVGPKTLMQLMGHDDIKTTLEYYVEASDEDLAAAMALVS